MFRPPGFHPTIQNALTSVHKKRGSAIASGQHKLYCVVETVELSLQSSPTIVNGDEGATSLVDEVNGLGFHNYDLVRSEVENHDFGMAALNRNNQNLRCFRVNTGVYSAFANRTREAKKWKL